MEAAVFDLDGTLVLSERRNRMVWEAFFARHGIALDDALFRQVTGRRGSDALAELSHLFPGREVAELLAEVAEHAADLPLPPPDPVPGAVELVRRVAATGAPVGLVTSADRAYAELALEALGIRDRFREIVGAADVTRGKPDPQGYVAACTRLAVAPGRAVGFEDAPAGIAAVKAAGMRCVGVATVHPEAALAAADVVVRDLTEATWPVEQPESSESSGAPRDPAR